MKRRLRQLAVLGRLRQRGQDRPQEVLSQPAGERLQCLMPFDSAARAPVKCALVSHTSERVAIMAEMARPESSVRESRPMIALLSDVHSNLQALQARLRHARENGAQRLVFLGDLVG